MFGFSQVKDFYNTAKSAQSGLGSVFGNQGTDRFNTGNNMSDASFNTGGGGMNTIYDPSNNNSFQSGGGFFDNNTNMFSNAGGSFFGGGNNQNQNFFGGNSGGRRGMFGTQMPMFGGGMQPSGGGIFGGMNNFARQAMNPFGGFGTQPFGGFGGYGGGMGSIYGNYFGNQMGTSQIPYGQSMQFYQYRQPQQQYRQPQQNPPTIERGPDPVEKPVDTYEDAQPIPVNPIPKPDTQANPDPMGRLMPNRGTGGPRIPSTLGRTPARADNAYSRRLQGPIGVYGGGAAPASRNYQTTYNTEGSLATMDPYGASGRPMNQMQSPQAIAQGQRAYNNRFPGMGAMGSIYG